MFVMEDLKIYNTIQNKEKFEVLGYEQYSETFGCSFSGNFVNL